MEQIRGAQFAHRPLPVLVTARQVRREGLADLDRLTSQHRQLASEEVLKLLGLLPASSSLRAIESSVYGEQVAGFYDPHTKRLALVKNVGTSDESVAEITLAHELTHALDDQAFGLHDQPAGIDDRTTAYTALVEGDATAVMTRYATRYMSGANLLGALFSSSTSVSSPLPRYIQDSLEFPYLEGEHFVQTLYRYARGWKLVNYAFRYRPPVSTAQVLHPLDFVRKLQPRAPKLRPTPSLGSSWRRIASGSFGEFDTRELLRNGMTSSRADQVASAWRGGRYQLWRTGAFPAPACVGPCRPQDALVVAWRTNDSSAARALGSGLDAYVSSALGGHQQGQGVWALPGGAVARSTQGRITTLAFAPSPLLADVLAKHAAS